MGVCTINLQFSKVGHARISFLLLIHGTELLSIMLREHWSDLWDSCRIKWSIFSGM